MQANGFRLKVTDVLATDLVRRELGIPVELASCHTSLVDGYILEGHVSANDVRRLLRERPPVKGLFVPGMPAGAPGMAADEAVAYDVLSWDGLGDPVVFATHDGG